MQKSGLRLINITSLQNRSPSQTHVGAKLETLAFEIGVEALMMFLDVARHDDVLPKRKVLGSGAFEMAFDLDVVSLDPAHYVSEEFVPDITVWSFGRYGCGYGCEPLEHRRWLMK